MAQSEQGENQLVEQVSLIDILYKDAYRIDSYISQIMNGLLKRRKLQETNSESSTQQIATNIFRLLSGGYSKDAQNLTLSEMNLVPHDHSIIDLLAMLNLSPIEKLDSEEIIGRIVLIRCRISIWDFRKISDLVFAMSANPDIFRTTKKEADKTKRLVDTMSKMIPMNIEVECLLSDDSVVRGILKREYLLTAYEDIVATHGNKLPGIWNVVGILDSLNSQTGHMNSGSHPFRFAMDKVSLAADMFYREGNPQYSITPFLIFRGLEK